MTAFWTIPSDLKEKIRSLHNLVPDNFDYKLYLLLYPDLVEAGITTKEEAIEHYILFGKKEGRLYYNTNPELFNNIVKENTTTTNTKIYKQKTLKKLFDKTYVIALKNSHNQKLIKQYFDKFKIPFEFIDGINGKIDKKILDYYKDYLSWPLNDTRRHYLDNDPNRRLILGPGAIGLFLTYKKIFKIAIKNKYKNILIFEEDCLFDKNINLHLNNFLQFKNDFDLLFLGASHHCWNNPEILNIPNTITNYYQAPNILDGTFGIVYNCKILPELLDNMKNINAPIDSGPIRSILKKQNSYVIYPNIAIADTTPISSISNKSRNLRTHRFNVNWDLSNISFNRGTLKNSIILANYNSENTIDRCIKSVINQTYPNFELIIIDDNSTDNSVKIIKDNAQKDNRIKLIELDKNIGAYACRNIGIKNSNGFFISMLDSDDILLSKKLEIDIYNYFNHHSYEIFFSNMYRSQKINFNKFVLDTSILKQIDKERKQHLFTESEDKPYLYGHNTIWEYKFRFGLPTLFVEKTFFDKYGLWNEQYRYGMDIELIQRYVAKKYNEFIDHKKLWETIYLYQSNKYDIYLSDTMNYVSFPQNDNNATNVCKNKDRKKIHKECNKNLNKLVKINKIKKYHNKNITEIFCMMKNEEDIIKYFIEYHLSIVDNITIIDNGSSDKSLDIAKKYPIKIISNDSDFKNKALIVSDLMKNSRSNILLPMDIDEFMFLEPNSKKIFSKKMIKQYLSNLTFESGDKFCIKNIYETYPDNTDYWDINSNYTKMIFAHDGFLAVDNGFHKGSTTTNNIQNIDISYCHFHFRSKKRWMQNTKQKLFARLGDNWNNMDALKEYSGDSKHCVDEWINFAETGKWHSLQPKIKFKFPNKMLFD